jgi:integrase
VGSIPTLGSLKSQVKDHLPRRRSGCWGPYPRSIQDFWCSVASVRGSLRERRPGVWELVVQLPRDPTSARARQLSRTVHGTKREAQRSLATLVSEVSTGRYVATPTTFGELLDRWLDHVGDHLSPTTVREYRRLANKLLHPDLGSVPLRRMSTQRIDGYYRRLAHERGLSPASVRHVHAVLRGALGQAVRWGWLPVNPAATASPPRMRRREIQPPLISETRALLAAAEGQDSDFASLLRVLVATGVRRGEVCGLRWSDVDLIAGTAVICRSVASVAGGTVVKDTKTHAARRLALDPETVIALEHRRERAEAMASMCRCEIVRDAFVFSSNPDGSTPLHPDTVTSGFQRLCRRVGLNGVRLHDLRHLHATQLLAAGIPVRTVSGRLGHANAATTLNVYAHFLDASDRQAADVMAGLLRPPSSTPDR